MESGEVGKITDFFDFSELMPRWWNGIHEGLKIPWSLLHAGSSPARGTTKTSTIEKMVG